MQKELSNKKGSIAYHLTKNKEKLWACGNDIQAMRKLALQLPDDLSLIDKEAVAQAKKIFKTAKDHLFISCLCTYMTGDKVS